jgi:DNA-binding transcriptional ArsR family regulator
MILRNPEAISAYANPTRMAILSILAEDESTLSMVAEKLGTSAANLYHHIRKLLGARLIVLVETRATAKNVEKYYRASAYSYSIDFGGTGGLSRKHDGAVLRDELAAAIERCGAAAGEKAFVRLRSARIDSDQAAEFRAALERLLHEFTAKDTEEGEPYSLGIAFFPKP